MPIFRTSPALCGHCGNLFDSQIGVQMPDRDSDGNWVGLGIIGIGGEVPCPKCGEMADFRSDLISFVDQAYQIFKDINISKLVIIKNTFENLQSERITLDQFVSATNSLQQEIPELSTLKDIIPKTRTELYTVIGIILTIIGLIIAYKAIPESTSANSLISHREHVISTVLHSKETKAELNIMTPTIKNPPFNSPCYCGSGKKFKKCHGKR